MTYVRTNVVLDQELVEKAMERFGFRTKREAIDYALRRLVTGYEPHDMLDMIGIGWEGNLDELRGGIEKP